MARRKKGVGSASAENELSAQLQIPVASASSTNEQALRLNENAAAQLPLPAAKVEDRANSRQRIEFQVRVVFFLTIAFGLTAAFFGDWKIPALAVALYAIIGSRLTRNESNIERFADSLYYMGFLFTIWGLFFAFGPFAENVENLSSKEIITQFGIKLVTTVIALTARIVILQLRSSWVDETEEPREALLVMVQNMTQEIGESIKAFRDARDLLLREAQTGIGGIQQVAVNGILANQQTFTNQSAQMLNEMNSSIADLLSRFEAVDVPSDIVATKLHDAASAIANDLENFRQNIKNLGEDVSGGLSNTLDQIRTATANIDTSISRLSSLEQLASRSEAIVQKLEHAHGQLDGSLQRTTGHIDQLAETAKGLREATRGDVDAMRQKITTANAELTNLANGIRTDAQRFSASLTSSIRLLREAIERE